MFIKNLLVKSNWKNITTYGLLLAILFSGNVITSFGTCQPNNKDDQNEQQRSMLLGLKNRSEIRNENIKNITDIKNAKKDELTKLLQQQLVKEDENNSQVKVISSEKNIDITQGVAEVNTFYDYSTTDSGFSKQRYNFEYNEKTKDLNTKVIVTDLDNTTLSQNPVNQPTKKNELIENVSTKKSIDSVKEDEKFDVQKFTSELPNSNKSALCSTIKTHAVSGGTFSGNAAANYAINYAINYNSNYKNLNGSGLAGNGSDCANFSSQAMIAAGLAKDYNNNDSYSKDWYFDWVVNQYSFNRSVTWTAIPEQMNHMYNYENTGNWKVFKNGDSTRKSIFNDSLYNGDLIYVDWQNDGIWDHVYIISGWDWFAPSGEWKPKLSAHSSDRQNIPWESMLQFATNQGKDLSKVNFAGLHFNSVIR